MAKGTKQQRNNETYAKGFAYDRLSGDYKPFFSQYKTPYDKHVQETRKLQTTAPDQVHVFDPKRAGDFKLEAKHFGKQPGFSAGLADVAAQEELINYLLRQVNVEDMVHKHPYDRDLSIIARVEGEEAPQAGMAGDWHKYLTEMQAYGPNKGPNGIEETDDVFIIDPIDLKQMDRKIQSRAINIYKNDHSIFSPELVQKARLYDVLNITLNTKDPSNPFAIDAMDTLFNERPELFVNMVPNREAMQKLKDSIGKDILKEGRRVFLENNYTYSPEDKEEDLHWKSAPVEDQLEFMAGLLPDIDKENRYDLARRTSKEKRAAKIEKYIKDRFMSRAKQGKISDANIKHISEAIYRPY